ncbi:MAG: glucan biosynthesis protein [Geminicoccaceae bacterium]|nr:glucan biosynthesis protein [Geminicoccaceae bacterium]MCX8100844.1 glucan biosynthesis protein [Geminicoccaceae bacterium]MDW8371058.1 glucan biosynthesis protein [Geminicoccaceae bacterium]
MLQLRTTRRAVAGLAAVPWVVWAVRAAEAQTSAAAGPQPFSFERLIERTRELAARPYQPTREIADWQAALAPEAWRKIHLKPERTIWGDSPAYRVRPYPCGWVHRQPVQLHLVEDGYATPWNAAPELFELGELGARVALPDDLGVAGFTVQFPLLAADQFDQLLTFLGASYFRAVGRGTVPGAGARGLTLDTGLGRPEEFPAFREFYLVRPQQPFDPLTLYALLDSPRVAGAYRFEVVVREQTRIDVDVNLFFRAPVEQVGVAPLNAMFQFGAHDRSGVDDLRPAAHDVEGLAMWTAAGELLWRPVANPSELRLSVLVDENPRGFGLLQRTREFRAFEDIDARFESKPNLWVVPRGTWGKGSVRLIEVPSQDERRDNIVAFWTPAAPVTAGQELRFAYGLLWSLGSPIEPSVGRTRTTRIGTAPGGSGRRIVIDFERPQGAPAAAELNARVGAANAKLGPVSLRDHPHAPAWRVSFDVEPTGAGPVEMRCLLLAGDRPVSETWIYRLDKS